MRIYFRFCFMIDFVLEFMWKEIFLTVEGFVIIIMVKRSMLVGYLSGDGIGAFGVLVMVLCLFTKVFWLTLN